MVKKKISTIIVLLISCSLIFCGCSKKQTSTENTKTEKNTESTTTPSTDKKAEKKKTDSSVKEAKISDAAVKEDNSKNLDETSQAEAPEAEIPEAVNKEDTVQQQSKDESTVTDTSTVSVTGTYHYSEAEKLLDLVNQYRTENGLSTLTWDKKLEQAAKIRAAEASICWSHIRPNGNQWYTVSDVVAGENLAKGYSTAQETFNAWINSDGHRENLLWPDFKTMYVSYFEAENGWFWAQEFGY